MLSMPMGVVLHLAEFSQFGAAARRAEIRLLAVQCIHRLDLRISLSSVGSLDPTMPVYSVRATVVVVPAAFHSLPARSGGYANAVNTPRSIKEKSG
ncbi:hypothetical protein BDZ45DRAFT_375526 [Acephala macrosclerotiorum]|nr:hypothetical protein BDZ45DRAFT_375526 [Acephala macrosclerotiorum]